MKMKSNKFLIFILVLSFLTISLVKCSQTIKDTINLQQDERYILKLDDYYYFTSSQIDFPKNQLEENIKVPYTQIGDQYEGSNIQSITSFQDGLSSKYFIGYNAVKNEITKKFDIQIIYFHLEIIQGVLKRTQLASQTLFSLNDRIFTIYASFYSSTDGFITYQSNSIQGTTHFSYIENKGLIFISLKNIQYINKQVAMQGSGDNIYIIYVDKATVNLLKYQTGGDSVQTIDTQTINLITSDNIAIDTMNTILGYDTINNILYSFFIDYIQDKLIVNKLILPQLKGYHFVQSLQRFNGNLILTLINNSKSSNVYINLQYNKFSDKNKISITNFRETNLYFDYIPIFVDYNILVFFDTYCNCFQMINIEKKKVIFQQKLDNSYSFDPNQYIGNQFIINTTKKDNQGIVKQFISVAQIQQPLVVIIGTNELFEYTIHQSDQPYSIKIQITINVTNNLITKFTQNWVKSQNMITSLSNSIYQLPVEKYIIGSNFNPEVNVQEYLFMKQAYLSRVNKLKQITSVSIDNIQNAYQTDGLFAALIINQSGTFYSISVATNQINGQFGEVLLYTSKFQFQSTIGAIDNYGSFILQSEVGTQSFKIYIPFIVNNQLNYNSFTTNCSKTNFAFASDPQFNVLFILCDKSIIQINYQFNTNTIMEGDLFVVSQKDLIFDAQQYDKLICIKGNLFIYNDQSITAYDYSVNNFVGNPIQIPQLYVKQQVILFSQTFIISSSDQQKLTISLFSYDQFQNQGKKAVFIRNLIKDQPSKISLSLIPKRNKIEHLYVSSNVDDQYSLFRINTAYSQNQFYTTVTIVADQSNVPVISQDGICIVGSKQATCQQILEEATLTYELLIKDRDFNRQLTFPNAIGLFIGEEKQIYFINIVRNASTQYGMVDQNAISINQLKTDIQDGNFADRTSFYFNDKNVFNACILGWESVNPNAEIINRLNNVDTRIQSYVFTILYNQKAILETNQIIIGNNLLTIKGDFSQNCYTILDDSASKVQVNPQSFNQNIYVLCKARLYKNIVQFTQDQTGSISQAVLLDSNSQPFEASNQQNNFRRIVSIYSELWLFDPNQTDKYLIQKKQDSDQLSVQSQFISITSILSFNVISSLNLELQFFRSGLINVKNVQDSNNIQYSYYYLQDLLQSQNFFIGENDYIASIYQYSDTEFRIQYAYSFIYDISLSLSKDKLFINRASLYYFKDAFDEFQAGITGDQYTLLFGVKAGDIIVAAYNIYENNNFNRNNYLILSAQKVNQRSAILDSASITYITYVKQINKNQFVIFYTNGSSTRITISDKVGIKILNKQSFKNQVIIHPNLLTDEKYQIRFSIAAYNPSPSLSPSFLTIIVFSTKIFFLLSLLVL